jgi:hypothetical protein
MTTPERQVEYLGPDELREGILTEAIRQAALDLIGRNVMTAEKALSLVPQNPTDLNDHVTQNQQALYALTIHAPMDAVRIKTDMERYDRDSYHYPDETKVQKLFNYGGAALNAASAAETSNQ